MDTRIVLGIQSFDNEYIFEYSFNDAERNKHYLDVVKRTGRSRSPLPAKITLITTAM